MVVQKKFSKIPLLIHTIPLFLFPFELWCPLSKYGVIAGIVVSKSAVDEEHYPESPWKRIIVKWDNEPDKERLSAWDIEPLPKDTR